MAETAGLKHWGYEEFCDWSWGFSDPCWSTLERLGRGPGEPGGLPRAGLSVAFGLDDDGAHRVKPLPLGRQSSRLGDPAQRKPGLEAESMVCNLVGWGPGGGFRPG